MDPEEEKTLSIIRDFIQENPIEQGIANGYYLDCLTKLRNKTKEMQKDLSYITDLMKSGVIVEKADGIYRPIKNFSKQKVYEVYYKIQDLLRTNTLWNRKY